MSIDQKNRRHTAKFWLLVLLYCVITAVAVGLCVGLHGELPQAFLFDLLLPPWAAVLSMMAIVLTGLVADGDDNFSLFWVDVALLVLFAAFNLLHHRYLLRHWGWPPGMIDAAILAVWPWVFVILFVFIAFASLLRRAAPRTPHIV